MNRDASSSSFPRAKNLRQLTSWLREAHLAPSPCLNAALTLLALALVVNSARAVNPALSGSLTVPFLFQPDDPNTSGDQSYWYWSQGISGSLSLSVPSPMEITTSVLGNLNWSNPNNWNKFPLDTGGLAISTSGSGTWNVSFNGGSPYLDVLGPAGPTEGTVQ